MFSGNILTGLPASRVLIPHLHFFVFPIHSSAVWLWDSDAFLECVDMDTNIHSSIKKREDIDRVLTLLLASIGNVEPSSHTESHLNIMHVDPYKQVMLLPLGNV